MNAGELKSILMLLDDPDEKVFDGIKDVIVDNFGIFSSHLTKKLYSGECNDTLKNRISLLAQSSISRIFLTDFQNYTSKLTPEPSLLAGTIMIEKLVDSSFDSAEYSQYVRNLARKVWLAIGDNTGIETLTIIRNLFDEECIQVEDNGQISLNGIFQSQTKHLPKTLFNIIFLTICQENGINIRPILTPRPGERSTIEIGYVNKELAIDANLPSKYGAMFAVDSNLQVKREARILLGQPLPYFKYLKEWQTDRYLTTMADSKKYPAYYSVIMGKIAEVLHKNIKY
ncbi:MAG: hypothetical protein J5709_07580 [Bacteroidales bacterium]|nr:hypothetical protein [Bacteroidales bacterium]